MASSIPIFYEARVKTVMLHPKTVDSSTEETLWFAYDMVI